MMSQALPWPDDPADVRTGSLFSGYGGLELGVQAALGGTTAWHCEYDAAPSKILAHHWPDVPNLGDITTVDWTTVEPVHVLTGGSPCQDLSSAGKRKGMKSGTRSGLWASMTDAIDILRPQIVVWENVRGATSAEANCEVELCPGCVGDESGVYLRALGRVLGDLADLGYDTRWTGLRAADIGAPHGRYRIFVVATDSAGLRPVRGLDTRDEADHAGAPGEPRARGGRARAGNEPADADGGLGTLLAAGLQPESQRDRDRPAADAEDDGREWGGSSRRRGAGPADGGDRGTTTDTDGERQRRATETQGREPDAERGTGPARPAAERATAADSHGDDRGLEVDGPPPLLRARELLQRPASPTGDDGRPGVDPADPGGERRGLGRGPAADGRGGRSGQGIRVEPGRLDDEPGRGLRGEQGESGARAEVHPYVDAHEAGIDFGAYARSIRRWELILGRPAPSPVERAKPTKRSPDGKWVLAPAFSEWMMGLPHGWVSSPEIALNRGERLKACGNGVVPQQAEAAVRICLAHLAQEEAS